MTSRLCMQTKSTACTGHGGRGNGGAAGRHRKMKERFGPDRHPQVRQPHELQCAGGRVHGWRGHCGPGDSGCKGGLRENPSSRPAAAAEAERPARPRSSRPAWSASSGPTSGLSSTLAFTPCSGELQHALVNEWIGMHLMFNTESCSILVDLRCGFLSEVY